MTTVKDRSNYLELKPYKCYICEGLIGMSSNNKLYIGAAIFVKSVTIECGYCGRHTFWKPLSESLTKNNRHSI